LNPEKAYNILDIFDINSYEERKDKAISTIGDPIEPKTNFDRKALRKLKKEIGMLTFPIKTKTHLAEKLGLTRETLWGWGKINDEEDE